MDNVIEALDEYFCDTYADYVRLAALEGYIMPEAITLDADGNIRRREASRMLLRYQPEKRLLLARFKEGLADTDLSFSFRFLTFSEKCRTPFEKYAFHRVLPAVLKRRGESVENAGERLSIEPRFWKKLVKGRLYPEKNTVLAIALVCRLGRAEVNDLFASCGYAFDDKSVRDVVVRYLLEQRIFAPDLRDRCLAEYRVDSLPLKEGV